MTVPAGLEVRVLTGREEEFERGLRELSPDAFRGLTGGGFSAFLGDDHFFVFFEEAPDDFVHRLAEDAGAAPLRELLDRCTTFDPDTPDRSVTRDVHHVTEPPFTMHGEGEGNF